ncbi:GspH/FimT family pseudopilin [Rhizobium laguerreae]|uniref:GspH/FimT family pseudopilin n=1 Tax=Rhizobium laguerreae TaxID=1076926 RepID=UPI001C901955|nr:GspH/FimT family pseudopilin [Rhizobium laguerreae]MBY3136116.1 prepilin-type N-terminal cleavage/methylation domain-containing protein [Rhizobium laguerreae]
MIARISDRHILSAGFSLLEMLVVLAILGALFAVALPQFRPSSSATARNLASRIADDARFARLVAIKKRSETILSIDTAARIVRSDTGREDIAIPASVSLTATVGRNADTTVSRGDIRFFADGSSSGGEIRLNRDTGKEIRIKINWLTGSTKVVFDD